MFESIDRDLVRARLPRYIGSARVRELLDRWMSNGVVWPQKGGGTRCERPSRGIPQGDTLSPLLCNLLLDSFDGALLGQHFKLARYADDFVVLARGTEAAWQAREVARSSLMELGLSLSRRKTRIADFESGFKYLGTVFSGRFAIPVALRRLNGTVTLGAGYEDEVVVGDAADLPALVALSRALARHAAQGRLSTVLSQALARSLQERTRPAPSGRVHPPRKRSKGAAARPKRRQRAPTAQLDDR